MQSLQNVINSFPVTEEEYGLLDAKFGELCHYQAWQLLKMNLKNNCSDDQEDIVQDLRIAMIKAASYFKRQTYIESCMEALHDYIDDPMNYQVLNELEFLWENRKRHGANRQKFGEYQEQVLEKLVRKYIPKKDRPNRLKPLEIDAEFKGYCKSITWNEVKLKGKRITKEKFWRTGMVSVSEYDYMCCA